MKNIEPYEQHAQNILSSHKGDFLRTPLDKLKLPEVVRAEHSSGQPLVYSVVGDLAASQEVMLSLLPYSTRLDHESIRLRLMAQQAVLGEDVAVVGVQSYEPKKQELTKTERKILTFGIFTPLAERVLGVAEVLPINDRAVSIYGYSMGADVGTESAYMNDTDQNKGVMRIERLGAFEPARVALRGLKVVPLFGSSGKQLYKSVISNDSIALEQSFNIDTEQQKAQKQFDSSIAKGVIAYTVSDLVGNLAISRGFGNDGSLHQLLEMARVSRLQIAAGRFMGSEITPSRIMDQLEAAGAKTYLGSGDHSAGDRFKTSAALALVTVD